MTPRVSCVPRHLRRCAAPVGRPISAKIVSFPTRGTPAMSMADRDGFIWLRRQAGAVARRHHARADALAALWPWRVRRRALLRHRRRPAIFRLRDHTDRLFRSAQIFSMKIPYDKDEIDAAQKECVRGNDLTSCYLRPIVFYGSEAMGVAAKSNPRSRRHRRLALGRLPWRGGAGEGHPRQDLVVHAPPSEHHHVQCQGGLQLRDVDPRQPGSDARRLRRGDAARPAGLRLPRAPAKTCSWCATASCTPPTSPAVP